ncbi:MAG: YlxR family protein [Mycobacterium sp.]
MIQRENSAPVRTCIGCRERELAAELLRVVAVRSGNSQQAVTVDRAGNLPGRGAWLHPRPECLRQAIRRRAFGRALRITGTPDTSAVSEHFDGSGATEDGLATEQVAKNMSTP